MSLQGKAILTKGLAMDQWPIPSSEKYMRSFWVSFNFYKRFIRFFSEIAAPVTDVAKKSTADVWIPEVWDGKEDEAFRRLKTMMITAPVLRLPNLDRKSSVASDASEVSARIVLQ